MIAEPFGTAACLERAGSGERRAAPSHLSSPRGMVPQVILAQGEGRSPQTRTRARSSSCAVSNSGNPMTPE